MRSTHCVRAADLLVAVDDGGSGSSSDCRERLGDRGRHLQKSVRRREQAEKVWSGDEVCEKR